MNAAFLLYFWRVFCLVRNLFYFYFFVVYKINYLFSPLIGWLRGKLQYWFRELRIWTVSYWVTTGQWRDCAAFWWWKTQPRGLEVSPHFYNQTESGIPVSVLLRGDSRCQFNHVNLGWRKYPHQTFGSHRVWI